MDADAGVVESPPGDLSHPHPQPPPADRSWFRGRFAFPSSPVRCLPGRCRAIHRLLEIYSRLSNVYSTGHTDASTVYSESIESIINLLSSIGAIVPIGEMNTQGRWCQASVVGHSLRPAASVRCEGRKAVIHKTLPSRAGQRLAAGFNECPPLSGSLRRHSRSQGQHGRPLQEPGNESGPSGRPH